jgi:hypothetical protein
MKSITKLVLSSGLLCIAILGAGCNSTLSYVECTQPLADAWGNGDYVEAANISGELLDEQRDKVENNIVFFLEHASVLRAVGAYEESNWHFQTALDLMDERKGDLEGQSRTGEKLAAGSRELLALLTNLNAIPYRGFGYDRIMAHTYKTLNFLALGDKEQAQVELNRLYQTQQYLVSEEYDKQIGKDQDKIQQEQNEKKHKLVGFGADTGKLNAALADMHQDHSVNAAYAPYVNPFATYLKAIFDATNGNTENAKLLMSRVKGFGNNSFVDKDLQLLESGQPIENVTYVIFESNMAPFRIEELFEVVIPVPVEYTDENGNKHKTIVPIPISFSWPKLMDTGQIKVHQYAVVGDTQVPTEVIADMDAVVAKEFDIRWSGIKSRIFLSVLAKTTAQVIAAREGGLWGVIGGAIYNEVTKGTDSRTWRTLPSNFQVCRIATPADRKLKLGRSDNPASIEIPLIDGKVNVVYVKQSAPDTVPFINQFKLK